MPGDLHYAHEKFATARYRLAIGDGTRRERFLRAYLDQAHHALPLRSGLGPPVSQELADDLHSFGDDMSRRPAVAGEGTIAATVDALTDDEVHDAVARFLALASDLDREYYRSCRTPQADRAEGEADRLRCKHPQAHLAGSLGRPS